MKLLWCCLAALMTTALAGPVVDVEKTIKQVQSILQSNSHLPRLTREEIVELLNDIRAEDAKKSSSTEHSKEYTTSTTVAYNIEDNEINSKTYQDNIAADENEKFVSVTAPTNIETITKREPSVMVVLPYTPRDGSSLQELYTRPPRTEMLPESKVTPKPLTETEKLRETLHRNAQLANRQKVDFPAELQAFLNAHGLKGEPGQDSFLLPLEGFKPLPPAKVVDGTVQLPENILLSYDLISPSDMKQEADSTGAHSASSHYLYEPLRPEIPFELDTSPSEQEKHVLPLDMPKKRKTKSTDKKPNYLPIDYESIKVIPLNHGPSPVEDEKATLDSEQSKRQASTTTTTESSTSEASAANVETTTTAADSQDNRNAITNVPVENDSAAADTDLGASISDLEDSFGGAAPEMPGDSEVPPPRKNGFYWMLDWNSFLEVGDGDTKVNIRFEPKLGDPQMFLPVSVP